MTGKNKKHQIHVFHIRPSLVVSPMSLGSETDSDLLKAQSLALPMQTFLLFPATQPPNFPCFYQNRQQKQPTATPRIALSWLGKLCFHESRCICVGSRGTKCIFVLILTVCIFTGCSRAQEKLSWTYLSHKKSGFFLPIKISRKTSQWSLVCRKHVSCVSSCKPLEILLLPPSLTAKKWRTRPAEHNPWPLATSDEWISSKTAAPSLATHQSSLDDPQRKVNDLSLKRDHLCSCNVSRTQPKRCHIQISTSQQSIMEWGNSKLWLTDCHSDVPWMVIVPRPRKSFHQSTDRE